MSNRLQVLGPSFAAFPETLQEIWIRSGVADIQTNTPTGGGLISCTAMQAL